MIKNLVFVFPYRGVGGVSLLFLRLAEYLAEHFDASVFVVDYEDGCIAQNLVDKRVTLIKYEDDKDVIVPEDSHLIFQSMTPWSIYPSLRIPLNSNVFFWNCHPYNLVPVLPFFRSYLLRNSGLIRAINNTILRSYKKKIQVLLAIMLQKKSLVFMDESNVIVTKRHITEALFDVDYLPIPASDTTESKPPIEANRSLSKLHIAWVGRVVDFKYHILYRAIERIQAAKKALNIEIQITIVGSGDCSSLLREVVGKLELTKINYIDHLSSAELDSFLLSEVDVLLGMGTSALEGAKLGIPTILLDFSYKEVDKNYKFQWLKDQKNYNLGAEIGQEQFACDHLSMQRLLEELIVPNTIGDETRKYYLEHHSLARVAELLIGYLKQSTCTYNDLNAEGLLSPGILYSLFFKLRSYVN